MSVEQTFRELHMIVVLVIMTDQPVCQKSFENCLIICVQVFFFF